MASVITRSNHPDALWPGVLEWFGLNYDSSRTSGRSSSTGWTASSPPSA
jgi:hypothetical protein